MGKIVVNVSLSSNNNVTAGAVLRLLDKPSDPLCPDYEYAQLKILRNHQPPILELVFFY